jgi:hypothetical protein
MAMASITGRTASVNRTPAVGEAMLQAHRITSPRPDSRSAFARYKGREVDVNVVQDVVREGSYIAVLIHGTPHGEPSRTIEYITDYATFDEALSAGFDIARAAIDRRQN